MEGKTPPAQVAQCQDHLEHKHRSGMQQPNAGSIRARFALRWCPCSRMNMHKLQLALGGGGSGGGGGGGGGLYLYVW